MSLPGRLGSIAGGLSIAALVGCAGAPGRASMVHEAEQTRTSLASQDAKQIAPEAFAEAERALTEAKDAERRGDDVTAALHGERAVASYARATSIARLTRARQEDAAAREALERASAEARGYAEKRREVDREAEDLEKKLRVARESESPASSGPTEPGRERARTVAAQSLLVQARLICSAARLVTSKDSPDVAALDAADAALGPASGGKPVTIDQAARGRASCLQSLTRARRGQLSDPDRADALLTAMSRAGASAQGTKPEVSPSRDERGVVMTMRALFNGERLVPEAEAALKDLGRVAQAHPTFAVQVVLHDAATPSAADTATNTRRGEAIARALEEGGASRARLKVEQAGARIPVVDPSSRDRERNARVDVVFVSAD